MNLTESSFWARLYANLPLRVAARKRPIRRWIEQWVPPSHGTCLEIGCYPGRYLAVFGELGYRLSGIDLSNGVQDLLPEWLHSQGYRLGEFRKEDFFECHERIGEQFDVVCSFGFLEHFSDWGRVLEMHAGLVKTGGLLVVSVPNFKGSVQLRLRKLLDRDNLIRHNFAAMVPREWADHLVPLGFEVLFAGCFGRFDFWSDSASSLWQRVGVLGVKALLPLLRTLPMSDRYSPHCGIIARKIG